MTMLDSAFVSLSADTVDTSDASPAPVAAPKRRGRPAKVAPPSDALFSSVTAGGQFWLAVESDTADGFSVTVDNLETALSVTYTGPSDRTTVAKIKGKKGYKADADAVRTIGPIAALPGVVYLDSDKVSGALAHLAPAMSKDVTRYALCGLNIAGEEWCATDGHRLALVKGMATPSAWNAIVPADFVHSLAKAIKATRAGKVALALESGSDLYNRGFVTVHALVTGPALSVRLSGRCVDGQFPNYPAVIPSLTRAPFVGDAERVRAAFDAAPLLGDRNVARKLAFMDCGVVTFRHDSAPVPVPLVGPAGDTVSALYNARYLDDAIAAFDGPVEFYADDYLSPLTVRNPKGDKLALVMPMRA